MKKQTKAYLLTLLTITFWGTSATAFKIALQYVAPLTLLLYSTLVSSLTLFAILLHQGKLNEILCTGWEQAWRAALLGLLNPFLYYLVLFKAYSLLPGQIAMSINYGWPLALTILSVPILKQKLTRVQLVAVCVSFLGALVIATKGNLTDFGDVSRTGLVLAFGSTIIWASFWLLNAKDDQDPVIRLFQGFFFGFICTLLLSALTGAVLIPPVSAVAPLVYIGIFEMGVTFVLWLTALRLSSSAARVGNLIYISPFLSLVFLRIVIGEEIHGATFIGLFLIVGSILVQEAVARKKNPHAD